MLKFIKNNGGLCLQLTMFWSEILTETQKECLVKVGKQTYSPKVDYDYGVNEEHYR